MYNLKAEGRDQNIKAKQLRRKGIIPALIYGRDLKDSVLIQIPLADANRLLSAVSKGNTLNIETAGKTYNVLLKEITRAPISQQVEHLDFQHLIATEAVNNVIKVVLVNRDKNENPIQQHIEEIPYHALPKDFVQEVVIDMEGMEPGSSVKIEDLDIAKNENIKITIPEDTVIVNVSEAKRVIEETADTEANAEATTEAGKEE